jgi:predicted AAA+ superfamily ATPase
MSKWIERHLEIEENLQKGKVLIIYGPRQTGKTSLLESFKNKTKLKTLNTTGENIRIRTIFENGDLEEILAFVEGYELLIIDEAQTINNIGFALKLLTDHKKELTIIVTGSSSFELANQVGEPLVGRKHTVEMFPIAMLELRNIYNAYELNEKLEEFLIYGFYPEVITASTIAKKRKIVTEIANSYLFKDVLRLDNILSSSKINQIVRLLAFQVGSEISLNEIATKVSLDVKTVSKYLDILEKSFILKSLGGYSSNLRDEVTQKRKYYFYDTGIRNALVANFNPIELRNDIGALWENFLVMERFKRNAYQDVLSNYYFWRTYQSGEIDFIEEREGKLFAYEFKWGKKPAKFPKKFTATYENSETLLINKTNYLDFIL